MNLLITGATGFIGSHLVKKLLDDKHNVTAVVRSNSNIENLPTKVGVYVYDGNIISLIEFLKTERFDGMIHLAAYCPSSHPSEDLPDLIDANILFGTEMIEACAQSGVKWFINTGSYMQHFNDADYSPSILYAATKQAFLDLTRYWSLTGKVKVVTLELFDNFGVGDRRKKIFTLWRDAFKTGEAISMSPGKQIMDVSPVENVASAFAFLASLVEQDESGEINGQVFSLQSGERMTLMEWADLFQKITGKSLNLKWGERTYRDREIMNPWTRGKQIPGYVPAVSIEDAVKKYLEI